MTQKNSLYITYYVDFFNGKKYQATSIMWKYLYKYRSINLKNNVSCNISNVRQIQH